MTSRGHIRFILDGEIMRVDNVALVCPTCNHATRVGYRFADNGDKIRHCRRPGCGADIEK